MKASFKVQVYTDSFNIETSSIIKYKYFMKVLKSNAFY